MNDPHYERRQAREDFFDQKQKSVIKGKEHLTESAIFSLKNRKKDKPAKESFGWDVFNQDSIYRAYEKRVNKIPKLLDNSSATDRIDMMAKEVEEVIEKRNQFSRKRMEDDSKDVTSINDRNRKFNQKLDRNYAKFANQIKGNLERGTAM